MSRDKDTEVHSCTEVCGRPVCVVCELNGCQYDELERLRRALVSIIRLAEQQTISNLNLSLYQAMVIAKVAIGEEP